MRNATTSPIVRTRKKYSIRPELNEVFRPIKYAAPTHDSKMFLDCCGLVRQVLRDLKLEFGFNVGPWNQAYLVRTCGTRQKLRCVEININ